MKRIALLLAIGLTGCSAAGPEFSSVHTCGYSNCDIMTVHTHTTLEGLYGF